MAQTQIPRVEPNSKRIKMTIYLTPKATDNLEQLRFKRLDKEARQPTGSRMIEGLLNTAVKNQKVPAYPLKRRS